MCVRACVLRLQQMRRPTIDQLKLNPHLQQYMAADEFKVREAAFAARCAAKEADLKRREEDLDRRERDLQAREAKVQQHHQMLDAPQGNNQNNNNIGNNNNNNNNNAGVLLADYNAVDGGAGQEAAHRKAGLAPVPGYQRDGNVPSQQQQQQPRKPAQGQVGGAGGAKRYSAPLPHGDQLYSAYDAITTANPRGPRVI